MYELAFEKLYYNVCGHVMLTVVRYCVNLYEPLWNVIGPL